MTALRRRQVLRGAAALASTAWGPSAWSAAQAPRVSRGRDAQRVRQAAAVSAEQAARAGAGANGDEHELPGYLAAYSKGLPHDGLGQVQPEAYTRLLHALRTGAPHDFDDIPCAGSGKLVNPQAGLSYNLVGPDPAALGCPAAPRFASATQAAEMVELYWQALARDVPFAEYDTHPTLRRAAEELRRLGRADATPATVFRGAEAGSAVGPYISQLLVKEVGLAPFPLTQKFRSAARASDHLGEFESWLQVQNGAPAGSGAADAQRCFIRNGRDLAEYVHRDFSYQIPLTAALALLKLGAPANPALPYAASRGQVGFATFGAPHLFYVLATATHAALTSCWFQKWMVHRRLRPEELGGRVVQHLARRASYPLHRSLLDSDGLAATLSARGSALLTSSYPEGSPLHPAYPAGHAVLAGAGVTVLKAYFDESFVIPEPLVANADGLALRRYEGPSLTLRGELDKLAANMGMGRCFAGIHWRSDVEEGLRLGEEVAIQVLREVRLTTTESFGGFRFHRLSGEAVVA